MNRFVLAGSGSGVGKTTFTIGIMRALMKRGLTVQGFKCGPDYIDPTYHTAVTKRPSRNIDSFMMSHDTVRAIVARASQDVEVAMIEGVMGFMMANPHYQMKDRLLILVKSQKVQSF